MKKATKILLACLCVMVIMTGSVLGTLAFLTDREAVTNTFTVGKVNITVDETKVEPDGVPVTPAARTDEGNEYHLLPGVTYIKDPTMMVKADSEEAYVRLMVTFNCASELDAIFAPTGADLFSIFNGYDATEWLYEGETEDTTNNTITYEFRYKETVKPNGNDVVLDALFDSFTVPGFLTGEDLEKIDALEIKVEGHAIQMATFDTADKAWDAFDQQVNPNP